MDSTMTTTGRGKYGGAVREAGGSLAALGTAREEQYFRQQDEKLFEAMQQQQQQTKNNSSTNKNSNEYVTPKEDNDRHQPHP